MATEDYINELMDALDTIKHECDVNMSCDKCLLSNKKGECLTRKFAPSEWNIGAVVRVLEEE